MKIENESEFFDSFEEKHGDYDVLGESAYNRLLKYIEKTLSPVPGETWIDLGCGTGAFTKRLSYFDGEITGVDISEKSIARANKQSSTEQYLCGDIRSTSLPGCSFDYVVFSGVLHHLSDWEDRKAALNEALRLLKPKGHLFSFDPHAHSPSMFLYRDPRSPFYADEGKTENEILITRQQISNELNEVGFSKIHARGMSGISFRYVEGAIARKILPIYNLYEYLMYLSPFENIWGTFVVATASKPQKKSK